MSQKHLSTRLYNYLSGNKQDQQQNSHSKNQEILQRNFFSHLWISLGNKLADSLISPRLILPWLLSAMHAPLWVVSLLVPIREAGALLPQLIVASVLRVKKIRKWVWFNACIVLTLCGVALIILAITGEGFWGAVLVLVVLTILSLARGVTSITSKDVMAKTIDKESRGHLMGWSTSIAGGITLVAGVILVLLTNQPGRPIVAGLLLLATLGWAVDIIFCARLVEPESEIEQELKEKSSLVRVWELLKTDKQFLHFNISRSLLLSSALALPYIAILGRNHSGANLGSLGILVLISGIATMLASPFWGKYADHSSRNVMRDSGLIVAVICFMITLFGYLPESLSSTVWPYAFAYGFVVIGETGIGIGRKTYIINMGDGESRALYIALSNTITGILVLILGSILAALSSWTSLDVVLMTLAVGCIIGAWSAQKLQNI
ncbi:MFS transporter [Entomomonas asaccharolytica]|uniref:MFS transporter n=1 Tax=Entomomonas asaccharolytica TaxID=2785331 RepID=A0A974RXI5_9GAMM|nr:MFS transporter [Entomomonas asaccharolytica]QQP86301.1 hypothetical protein JHT90_03395 [Entomomonas asaccharolytica]